MESLKRRFIYTESPIIDVFYYGTGTTTGVTASYILSTFSTATGNVGSPTGREYTFGPTFGTYRYWAIPDISNDGNRVIGNVTLTDDVTIVGLEPSQMSYYSYYQLNPNPPSQTIKYAKIDINGVMYRLYRTTYKYGSSTVLLNVWSI